MRFAGFVGRVGALAVALGVGVSVAGMSGVAYADTGDTSTADTSAATHTTRTTKDSSSRPASDVAKDEAGETEANGPADQEPEDDEADDPADTESDDEADDDKSGSDAPEPSVKADAPDEAEPVAEIDSTEPTPEATEPTEDPTVIGDSDEAGDSTPEQPETESPNEAAPPPAPTQRVTLAEPNDDAPQAPNSPNPLAMLLTALFARRDPATVVSGRQLIRNRLEHLLVNKAPVFDPEQHEQNQGVVFGSFNAADANGDRLEYSIIDGPDWGSVEIDPDTGYYVYTAGADVLATGGIDGFTVRVNDMGLQWFDSVESETVFVPVTIRMETVANPTAVGESVVLPYSDGRGGILTAAERFNEALSSHPILAPLWTTMQTMRTNLENLLVNKNPTPAPVQVHTTASGLVYGTFNAFDSNGDRIDYTVLDGPAHGTVTINEANGTYIYTPHADFAATGGEDSFTVSLNDLGWHLFDSTAPITQTVSVSVSPVTDPAPEGADEAPDSPAFVAFFPVKFHNYTSKPLTVMFVGAWTLPGWNSTEFHNDDAFQQAPVVGQVINPGESIDLKAIYYPLVIHTYSQVIFQDPTGAQTNVKILPAVANTQADFHCDAGGGSVCQFHEHAANIIHKDDAEVVLMDAAGTSINTDDPVKQALWLNAYCGAAPNNCQFTLDFLDTKAFTPEWEAYPPFRNDTDGPLKTASEEVSREVSTQHSVKVSAKAGFEILKAVKAELSAEYSYQVAERATFKITYPSQDVPAHTKLTIYAQAPVLNANGTMTVKYGNTTYHLNKAVTQLPDKKESTDPLSQQTITGRNPLSFRAASEKLPHSTP